MPDMTDLSFPPPPPEAPRYDSRQKTWTLSRYADVHAALREPTFRQCSSDGKITYVAGQPDHTKLRAGAQADIDRMNSTEWRARMVNIAQMLVNLASRSKPVDLVKDVIQPWSTSVILSLSMAPHELEGRLAAIADRLFHKRENYASSWRRIILGHKLSKKWSKGQRNSAERTLDRLIDSGQIKISKSMFFAGTQTLPSALARAWHALLLHPAQMEKLRNEPDLMPSAVEELLRHAGIVHSLHRLATEDVVLRDIEISKFDRLVLKLESANRDPLKFDSPDQLDISRRPTGSLAFGIGPHACIGAALVRTTLSIITPVFLAADPRLESDAPVIWTADSSVQWPVVVRARLHKRSSSPLAGEAPESWQARQTSAKQPHEISFRSSLL
jgi:cytochrome P450